MAHWNADYPPIEGRFRPPLPGFWQLSEWKRRQWHADPEPADYDRNPKPPGVALSDRRPASDWMTELLELELPEDLLLPYEITEPGYIPRRFFVPARILNAHRTSA